jgi:hypothetical protein
MEKCLWPKMEEAMCPDLEKINKYKKQYQL